MSVSPESLKIGAINPYALAELVVEKKINWNRITNPKPLLEEILERPYDQLFDPKFSSPLYAGTILKKKRLNLLAASAIKERTLSNLTKQGLKLDKVKILSDLKKEKLTQQDIDGLEILDAEFLPDGTLSLHVELADAERMNLSNIRLDKKLKDHLIASGVSSQTKWQPTGSKWMDTGRFFNEAAEATDPVQGAVGNCYFIGALASVAWAHPELIAHRTRPTGVRQSQFTNKITFFSKGGSKDKPTKEIEVTDELITNGSGNLRFAKSSENGEIWCGIYEKAFAKWITENSTDNPDISATAYGNCVKATAQIINGKAHYFGTQGKTIDEIYSGVRSQCRGRKTFNPMTAWTYSSSDAAPGDLVYSDANLVANHCYSILGWAYRNRKKYIVLRNPWGRTEATENVLTGTWMAHDTSFWRPIALAQVDGVFALEVGTFKRYFAGWGYAEK